MAKDDELITWCPTCEKPRAVTRTMGDVHILECGHHVQQQGR